MLLLPATIRVPVPEDFPHREDIEDLLLKRQEANITQGFVTRPNKTPVLPFEFLADININNNRLWQLFVALSNNMPGQVCCTYGLSGEDAVTTGLLDKAFIVKTLQRFEQEVTMDCSMEFGLLHHTKGALTEIVITECKYIKYSGSNMPLFLQQMAGFGLKEIRGLAFVDEYPKLVLPLKQVLPAARRVEDVIWSLNKAFGMEE